ncbi:MAG: dynamin family protein [Thiotrichales bacterium]
MSKPDRLLQQRLTKLKTHLERENPLLVSVVDNFELVDRIAYRTGLLGTDESFANHVSWWPLISVLGTFSAGKSTFINTYLSQSLQATGNQAVDDKFTVLTFSGDDEVRVLPGLALDADPRFPFYQISEEIEKVSVGEGAKIDSYLQLKTCHSERLRGKILIDSPGFDADAQRNTILRITDHIIGLSDLVLVFFDARHPEPGAMHDTLEHLVKGTLRRNDANKFIFILNQIDTTARDDNLEDVVAAWQKAIAQTGMTAGTFYCLFSDRVAVPIEQDAVRERYLRRRDRDLGALTSRIEKVSVERAYRLIGGLEHTANSIEQQWIPRISKALREWRKRVLVVDGIVLGTLAILALIGIIAGGLLPQVIGLMQDPTLLLGATLGVVVIALVVHFLVRARIAKRIAANLLQTESFRGVSRAFLQNTRWWRNWLRAKPMGWGRGSRKRIASIREMADQFVQSLNDRFTNPSGSVGNGDATRS